MSSLHQREALWLQSPGKSIHHLYHCHRGIGLSTIQKISLLKILSQIFIGFIQLCCALILQCDVTKSKLQDCNQQNDKYSTLSISSMSFRRKITIKKT